jgi:transcriptional regulator with XRE-family HTH domain
VNVVGPPGYDEEPRLLDIGAIGRRITQRREQFGLKQLDLARQVDMSEAYINRLENGVVRNPKILDLAQVARALDLSLDDLLYGASTADDRDMLILMSCDSRLTKALARLIRGVQRAADDERELIVSRLESLARRLDDGPNRDHR